MESVYDQTMALRVKDQAAASGDHTYLFDESGLQTEREIQALNDEIKQLKEQNERLSEHIFALNGPQGYATPNDLQQAVEVWYSAIQDFCLRTFEFPSEVDPTELSRTWKCERFKLLEHYETDIFDYLTTAWLFELLKDHIYQHFMIGMSESIGSNGQDVDASLLAFRNIVYDASESRPDYREALIKWRCDTTRLMLPLLGPSAKQLAHASTNSFLQDKLFEESGPLTEAMNRLTKDCQNAIEKVTKDSVLKPLRGKRLQRLMKLVKSGIVLDLNMRTSRTLYQFLSISSGSKFDGELMESVGHDDDFAASYGESPTVLFTVTHALVEVNEHGKHTRCISKAKVVMAFAHQARLKASEHGKGGIVQVIEKLITFGS